MRSFTLAGTVLVLAGLGCFGAGAVVLKSTIDRQRVQDDMFVKSERSCREQVVKIGKVTPGVGDTMEIDVIDVKDPKMALAQATSILAMCPSRSIAEMCIGSACSQTGLGTSVRMVVKLTGAKK